MSESSMGRVVRLPLARHAGAAGDVMARTAASIGSSVTRLTEEPGGVVDDWGRDPDLARLMVALTHLRWSVAVGGDQQLPRRKGALICINARPLAQSTVLAAFAISDATDRPVRYVGRPDGGPVGAFAQRLGALLAEPDEISGALAAGELVVMSASATNGGRDVGAVDHSLIGAAVAARTSVFPTAVVSSPMTRTARVEIGAPSRSRNKRRGPLAELELADRVRHDIGRLLDELGDIGTGTPLDWLPIGVSGGN